jgi:hypothetical protein
MIRYFIFIIAFCSIGIQPLKAASGYAGEFLAVGAGARALALGNAFVAIVDDATSGYWNAAGLADLQTTQVHLMHAERFSGLVDQDFLAVALPGFQRSGWSVGLLRVGVNDIEFTTLENPGRSLGPDNRPIVASTETSADYALYFSGARRFHDRLSLGLSAKALYRSAGSFSAYGFGLDLGLRYHLGAGIRLAANLRDITTTPIFWDTNTTDRIQPSVLLGLAYTRPVGAGKATFALASHTGGDAVDQADNAPLNAGLEYWYKNAALRLGVEDSRQTFGLGLKPHQRLTLDLAYLQHNELEATYLLSADLRF